MADVEGVTIIDDYAHHPTEIDATLEARKIGVSRAANHRGVSTAPLYSHA